MKWGKQIKSPRRKRGVNEFTGTRWVAVQGNHLGRGKKVVKPVSDANRPGIGVKKLNEPGKAHIEHVFDAT